MRKLLASFLALMLCVAPVAALGAEDANDYLASINPNGYDMLMITDIFTNEDSELYDDEAEAPAASLTVQGCFGTVDMSQGEDAAENVGFDSDDVYSFGLAEDCEMLMPADIMNPVENVRIEDLQAWYDGAKAALQFDETSEEAYVFYAYYEMNQDGNLTRLEYVYFPWN